MWLFTRNPSHGFDWSDNSNRAYQLVREADRDWIRAANTHGPDSPEAVDARRFLDTCEEFVHDQRDDYAVAQDAFDHASDEQVELDYEFPTPG